MDHKIFTHHAIGSLFLRAPGEIEAEIAEFIDRAAKLIAYHAERHSVSGSTKLGDLMMMPLYPSGKALGELTWTEMQTAYDCYVERAAQLNPPFHEQIESI